MSYRWNSKIEGMEVFVSQRDPRSRIPKSLRRICDDDGNRILTEAAAKRIEQQLVQQLEEAFKETCLPTWNKICEMTFESMLNRGISEKTVNNYYLCLKAHTFPIWGRKRINEIQTSDIRKLILEGLAHRSDAHKKSMLKMIRAPFKYAVDENYIQRNPTPDLRIGRGTFKIRNLLTEPQMNTLLTQSKIMGNEWYEIYAVAIYTGMRNGEIYALTWPNVDLDNRLIYVRSNWDNTNGFKDLTKSGDDRIVEIAPPLLTVLKELKLKNPETHFVLPRLRKWDKGEQARELRMFLMGLGLPPVRFHDLRASWATHMLGIGVEPIKVMKMGGWKDLKTMQIYIRKAGVDIKGITDRLSIHDPSTKVAMVLQLGSGSEM